MKRSDFEKAVRRMAAEPWTDKSYGADGVMQLVDQIDIAWDPEEPEGFAEWSGWRTQHQWVRDECLAAWNACLSRQEAQQRTIKPKVDPEVRRKEIEAQIEAWAHFQYGLWSARVSASEWTAAARGLLRNYLHLEGY